ncbi:aminomethyl-transferring glycine dehydrogenase subunit GcvPA [Leucobacter manosquensis]|nr:aminomethyl-transferring glycine dehydrogenase subunit GcvPA [Leucobacter manosquensis]
MQRTPESEKAPQATVCARDARTHPYLPHTAGDATEEMLRHIGAESLESLFVDVPSALRQLEPFGLPPALRSEADLARYVRRRLSRNTPATRALNFCGAGVYQHDVPSVCVEVAGRAEFVSAYAGEPYEDHGKHQALFEYQCVMAELLEMDVVSIPTYDGYQAAGTALRMAGRITGHRRAVAVGSLLDDKRSRIAEYVAPTIDRIEHSTADIAAVRASLDEATAAVFLEIPDAEGLIDADIRAIADAAHAVGAIFVVSVDPIALGLLAAPASLGADIVCGDLQSLGNGMHFGGAHAGFLAVHDDPRFVYELPTRLFGAAPTRVEGELGFTDLAYERTSLAARENGVEWIGTASSLSAIVASVFLSLHGPHGMRELGDAILDRTSYAMEAIAARAGAQVRDADRPHFREFVVVLPDTAPTADALLERLVEHGVFGGVALNDSELLVAVTEVHTRDDIDTYIDALAQEVAA